MGHARGAAVAVAVGIGWLIAGGVASSQTSVIRQSVAVDREGSSVTVSGPSISVETAAGISGRVVGNGQPGSQQRPIGPVTAIAIDGAFALTIKIGPAPGLTIETDKNLLPIVKTEIADGRLDIFTDRSYAVDGRIRITLTSPGITEISASGSNQINAEGLTGGPLSITLNGSNSAVLTGKASALTGRLSGANHLSARQLATESANVTVEGSSDASVNASRRIVAAISGAGSVAVYGNPAQRQTQVSGAGKINFVE